jgi:phytoene dehydrogenase-like protein
VIRSHYDVVVVGARLSTWVAAALLGKRGLRVLVLGQDELPPSYEVAGRTLPRGPFNFLPASSPIARKTLAELALQTTFRRHATAHDPAFQVAMPGMRFDLAAEPAVLLREIEREFPTITRTAEHVLSQLREGSLALDRALENDLAWPPETFFERRAHARATRHMLYGTPQEVDPLAALPEGHPFRFVLTAPARFADGIDPDSLHGLRLARLFSSWATGGAVLSGTPVNAAVGARSSSPPPLGTSTGGWSILRRALEESVRAHGGDIRERERIDAIEVKRGQVTSVRVAASGEQIGASWVLVGTDVATLLRLLPDRRPLEEVFEELGEPTPRYYRYTLNLVLRSEGVPMGLARDAFLVRDPRRPLSAANLLHVETHPDDGSGERLMVIEALLPRRVVEDVPGYVETVREDLLASLGELVPFLGDHLILIDSPHDGRPGRLVAENVDVEPLLKWQRGFRTMDIVHGYPITGALGITALPLRTPIRRMLLCNHQIVPGLGMEGELLAGSGAARLVEKTDPRSAPLLRSPFGSFGR